MNNQYNTAVIIPNWNEREDTLDALASLKIQSLKHIVIVVDNNSSDGSNDAIKTSFPDTVIIKNSKNLGFAGGVNPGLKYCLENGYTHAALLNNDAVADSRWLKQLYNTAIDKSAGIVTSRIATTDNHIDSTGDQYTSWGLPYPRGRNEPDSKNYLKTEEVTAASGGASLYSMDMLRQIGLFDEDFFAYYEDVDISLRAQLRGWRIYYQPKAKVRHKIGTTSAKMPGFTTYMTIKNMPWLFWKNVPLVKLVSMLPKFCIAYTSIVLSALLRGDFVPVFKGLAVANLLMPKKLWQRRLNQSAKTVSNQYFNSLIENDLPPNAHKLRRVFGPRRNKSNASPS
jgi:GT2 family glycosyltransferase